MNNSHGAEISVSVSVQMSVLTYIKKCPKRQKFLVLSPLPTSYVQNSGDLEMTSSLTPPPLYAASTSE